MAKLTTRMPTCITNLNPLPGLVDDTELLDTYRVVLENILRLPSGGVDESLIVVMMGVRAVKTSKQSFTLPDAYPSDVFKNCSVGDVCYWSFGWRSLSTQGCRDVIRHMVAQQALPQLLCTRESTHVWDAMEPWLDQLYRFAYGRHQAKQTHYVPRKLMGKPATTPMGDIVSLKEFKSRHLDEGLEE